MIKKTTMTITIAARGPEAKEVVDEQVRAICQNQYAPLQNAQRIGDTATLVFSREWDDGQEEGGQMAAAGPATAETATDTAAAETDRTKDDCQCLPCQIRRSMDELAGAKGDTLGGGVRVINLSDIFRKSTK